ncbi:MAG: hypothetical protein M3536_00320 [Actinomycetota bacterium]|nr:hypothetical protein [Actinomycetota bacterium]
MEDLREVESMVEALWASAARQDVGTGSVGKSGHSAPSDPTNSRAYDAGRTLNVILTGWARALGHTQPHAVKAARVLLANMAEVRAMDWAAVLKQELHDALNDCRSAMDRRGPTIFAGICPTEDQGIECGTPVYTPEGKTDARCSTCGSTWDVTDWRERALKAAGPATGTPAEISRMLSDPIRALVFPVNKISVWVNRGKLTHVNEWDRWMAGIFGKPVPPKLYQVRKVRNLWERSIIESAARSARIIQARQEREQAELLAA